jgi:carbon storage regulator
MLVLSRKTGQEVVTGQDIRVIVLSVRGSRVKLGFSGPEEVAIRRRELCEEDRQDPRVLHPAIAQRA